MNLFDQYVEKLLFNLYFGDEPESARASAKEIIQDVVASAQYDKVAVDEFLELDHDRSKERVS